MLGRLGVAASSAASVTLRAATPTSLTDAKTSFLESLKPARRRGVPTMEVKIDDAVLKNFMQQRRAGLDMLNSFGQRITNTKERTFPVDRSGVLPVVTVSRDALLCDEEKQAVLHTVFTERGEAAAALNRRSARAAGLQPHESYMLRVDGGPVVAIVLREVIPKDLSLWWDAITKAHRITSNGWFLGCQADQLFNPQTWTHMMKTEQGAAAMRYPVPQTLTPNP